MVLRNIVISEKEVYFKLPNYSINCNILKRDYLRRREGLRHSVPMVNPAKCG
jgi:hypothetical protein